MYRWQSDDSDLFFLFYKHFHNTLKTYISDSPHDMTVLTMLPGYMYLATYFSGKIDSLIQRKVLSVTHVTASSVQNSLYSAVNDTNTFTSVAQYEENDRSSCSVFQSGKPKTLEMATRKFAECMVWCVSDTDLYHGMLNVWLRSAINKTRLTETEQVYCLIDFIEQIILELQRQAISLFQYSQAH